MNNTANNRATRITKVDNTTFDCVDTAYVSNAGASAGVVYEPASLKASTGSDGMYFISMSIDGTAQQANKQWKWEANVGVTETDNIVTERFSTATLASVFAGGMARVAAGDMIWVSAKNITDNTDYTVRNFNLSVHKVGP